MALGTAPVGRSLWMIDVCARRFCMYRNRYCSLMPSWTCSAVAGVRAAPRSAYWSAQSFPILSRSEMIPASTIATVAWERGILITSRRNFLLRIHFQHSAHMSPLSELALLMGSSRKPRRYDASTRTVVAVPLAACCRMESSALSSARGTVCTSPSSSPHLPATATLFWSRMTQPQPPWARLVSFPFFPNVPSE